MALVKCKECGKEISTRAKSCPLCGWKKKNIAWEIFKFCWSLSVLIIVALVLFGIHSA